VLALILTAVLVAASTSIAQIHGKIVAIDAKRGVFTIHHAS